MKPLKIHLSVMLVLLCALAFSGCAHKIKYSLRASDIVRAQAAVPIKVAVARLDDRRDAAEKSKPEREARDSRDAGDYTYDKDFGGSVAANVTRMLVKHLEYSECFQEVSFLDKSAAELDANLLDSLQGEGVDAVMVGSLENFYGCYDRNQGNEILMGTGLALAFGIPVAILTTSKDTKNLGWGMEYTEVKTNPIAISLATTGGAMLGAYLESTKKRDTDCHTRVAVKLMSIPSRETLFEEAGDASNFEHRSLPGLRSSARKHELALSSLRDAINDLAVKISDSDLASLVDSSK